MLHKITEHAGINPPDMRHSFNIKVKHGRSYSMTSLQVKAGFRESETKLMKKINK